MISRILRLPVVVFLAFLVAGAVVQSRLPLLIGMPSFKIAVITGSALFVAAAMIAWAGLSEMHRHRTTVEPGQRPTALVTSGVFSFSRNPLYLSLLLVFAGLAMMADGLCLLGFALLFWVTLDRVIVRSEEKLVESVFGDDYVAYKARVRRWV